MFLIFWDMRVEWDKAIFYVSIIILDLGGEIGPIVYTFITPLHFSKGLKDFQF